jgi:hypothetical protein
MSQRFGRNQRRRAREALVAANHRIADLELAHVLDSGLLADMSERLCAIRQEIDDAKAIAGPMSILFPVEHEFRPGVKSTDRQPLSIDIPGRMPDSFICDSPTGSIEELRYSRLTLETLVLKIRPDVLHECVHVNVEFADGVWRYGLTRPAWYALPHERRQRLIAQVIPKELAREVAKHGFR